MKQTIDREVTLSTVLPESATPAQVNAFPRITPKQNHHLSRYMRACFSTRLFTVIRV